MATSTCMQYLRRVEEIPGMQYERSKWCKKTKFTSETIGSLEESLFLLQVYVDSEEEETVEVPR